MLTVLTVCRGLPVVGVARLKRGVERHLPVPHRFVCLYDGVERASDGIEWISFEHDFPAHWSKVECWRPDLEERLGRVLYLDLSCVITADLTPLAQYEGEMCVVKDFWYGTPCQSVAAWREGAGRRLWEYYMTHREVLEHLGSHKIPPNFHDQTLLNFAGGEFDLWPDELVSSFKLSPFRAPVVKFHGSPKPHETEFGRWHWFHNALPPPPPAREPCPTGRDISMTLRAGWESTPVGQRQGAVSLVVGHCDARPPGTVAGLDAGLDNDFDCDIAIYVRPTVVKPAEEQWAAGHVSRSVFTIAKPEPLVFWAGLTVKENAELHADIAKSMKSGDAFTPVITTCEVEADPLAHALSVLYIAGYRQVTIYGQPEPAGERELTYYGEVYRCTDEEHRQLVDFAAVLHRAMMLEVQVKGRNLLSAYVDCVKKAQGDPPPA